MDSGIEAIEALKQQVQSMTDRVDALDDGPAGLSLVPDREPTIEDFVLVNEKLCEALRLERQHSADLQATLDEMIQALREVA